MSLHNDRKIDFPVLCALGPEIQAFFWIWPDFDIFSMKVVFCCGKDNFCPIFLKFGYVVQTEIYKKKIYKKKFQKRCQDFFVLRVWKRYKFQNCYDRRYRFFILIQNLKVQVQTVILSQRNLWDSEIFIEEIFQKHSPVPSSIRNLFFCHNNAKNSLNKIFFVTLKLFLRPCLLNNTTEKCLQNTLHKFLIIFFKNLGIIFFYFLLMFESIFIAIITNFVTNIDKHW